jgi:hypothetical protein
VALELHALRETVHRLPPFALPHKRFVSQVVQEKAREYLGCETSSYRASCQQQGRALVYDDRQEGPLAKRASALRPSTLWRWLSWLGNGLPKTLGAARQLIREKESRSTLHREAWTVASRRYRSDARRQCLERALELLVVQEVFQRLFGKAIFPNLATAHGWN